MGLWPYWIKFPYPYPYPYLCVHLSPRQTVPQHRPHPRWFWTMYLQRLVLNYVLTAADKRRVSWWRLTGSWWAAMGTRRTRTAPSPQSQDRVIHHADILAGLSLNTLRNALLSGLQRGEIPIGKNRPRYRRCCAKMQTHSNRKKTSPTFTITCVRGMECRVNRDRAL